MTSNQDIDEHNEQRVIALINDLRAKVDILEQNAEITKNRIDFLVEALDTMLATFRNLYKGKK